MDYETRTYWDRKARQRISRRRGLQGMGVAGVGLTTAALIGCGDDDSTGGGSKSPAAGGSTAALTPKKGGQLTLGMPTQPRSLDFHFDVFVPVADHTNNALLKFN